MNRLIFCLLLSTICWAFYVQPVQAQPTTSEMKAHYGQLANLGKSKDKKDFLGVEAATYKIIREDPTHNRFAHAVLFTKLLLAVDSRITKSAAKQNKEEDFSDLIELGSGNITDIGAFAAKPENPGTYRDVKDEKLQNFLAGYQPQLMRTMYVFFLKYGAEIGDLKKVVDRATDDPELQKRTFQLIDSEFKTMVKKYDFIGGKLYPR